MIKTNNLGPVVPSISLTISLVKGSLKLLVCIKSSVLILFAEKMTRAFALQKLLTFFQQKNRVCIKSSELIFVTEK